MAEKPGKTYEALYKALGGRPETRDREQMAVDLLNWSMKEDSLNLNGFCSEKKIPPVYITRWAKEDDRFRLAYETVKATLGARRELALAEGRLHTKAYDLNANVYDQFLKEESREEKTFEAKLKTDSDKEVNADLLAKNDEFNAQLEALRKERKAPKTKK